MSCRETVRRNGRTRGIFPCQEIGHEPVVPCRSVIGCCEQPGGAGKLPREEELACVPRTEQQRINPALHNQWPERGSADSPGNRKDPVSLRKPVAERSADPDQVAGPHPAEGCGGLADILDGDGAGRGECHRHLIDARNPYHDELAWTE